VEKIGWELYRARRYDDLRRLLEPYRPVFESLAARIAADPSEIAYASTCAQMFVFSAELGKTASDRRALAERAISICPTHRNARLILASALCDDAMAAMRKLDVFNASREVPRIEALLARAESLYPQSTNLPIARRMLEKLR
jgi:hypothetical protein